jgi:hypothetical protein
VTAAELAVERAVGQKRDFAIVWFKIRQDEIELRRPAMFRGARYNGKTWMWQLHRSEALRMGVKSRIAVNDQELLEEQVHP